MLSEEPGIADDAVQVAMDIESPFLVMESNRDVIAPEAEASGKLFAILWIYFILMQIRSIKAFL